MSIFTRIFKIGEAGVNKAIDSMENPELMLEQAIRDKDKQIREAKRAIQGLIASERQAKAQFEKEKKAKEEWEAKAEMALKAGKEELAVKALQRAQEYEGKLASLESNWKSQLQSIEGMKNDIRKMDDQLAEYKRNKDYIIAQSKAADVKKNIYEAKARISKDSSADDLMARMRDKAERKSYEADAAKEMADDMEGGDSLEKEFADFETAPVNPDVNDKLAALKAKLGQGGTSGQTA